MAFPSSRGKYSYLRRSFRGVRVEGDIGVEILANFSYGRAQPFVLCKYISKVCHLLFLEVSPLDSMRWNEGRNGKSLASEPNRDCVSMYFKMKKDTYIIHKYIYISIYINNFIKQLIPEGQL